MQQPEPLSGAFLSEAARIANMVSWAYCRRCWWVEQPELESLCWVVCLEVWQQEPWAQTSGADGFGTVCYVACMRQLGRQLRRMQAPASASDHDVKLLAEQARPNDLEKVTAAASLSPEAPVQNLADRLVAIEQLRAKIRGRIFQLLGRTPGVEASALVMLDGLAPREVAQELGLDVWEVYRANEVVVGVSRADQEIGRLARELGEERRWL